MSSSEDDDDYDEDSEYDEFTITPIIKEEHSECDEVTATPPKIKEEHIECDEVTATPPKIKEEHIECDEFTATPPKIKEEHIECDEFTATPSKIKKGHNKHVIFTATPSKIKEKRNKCDELTATPPKIKKEYSECNEFTATPPKIKKEQNVCVEFTSIPPDIKKEHSECDEFTATPSKIKEECHIEFTATPPKIKEEHNERDELTSSPPEVQEEARAVIENTLPPNSRDKYLKTYENFVQWKNQNRKRKSKSLSENVFMDYFADLAKKVKPTTLWVTYSMLKCTILMKHNVNLKQYENLTSMLKTHSDGYKCKKSEVFTLSNVKTFLSEAPDSVYLHLKVVLIFGISGACRCNELTNINIKDVENYDGVIIVNVRDSKTNIDRSFVIRDESAEIVQKYIALRPADVKSERFFLSYKNNKCSKQVIGRHKIAEMPKRIAMYLKLPNPESYTGHCFRRSSATLHPETGVKTTIIYPATEKHITKYSQQETHIILETPQLYQKYTAPHVDKEQFTLQWVYNILEGKSEQDRIVYDNKCDREGFVLLPDLKWDGLTKETLYLLAIVRQRGIKSLRDLTEEHLPLLKRVRDEGKKAILDKYKVAGSQLRIYLHYQPTFYHLHVHFTYLKHEAPGIYAEKSHLLDTVIDNIEMMSSYYQRATLPFTIREMDTLFDVYETNGYIERIKENTELIDK